ncbi:MAG: putative TPR domain protein, component of TonB system [Nitrosopumilales archaeon]|nr:MAG: putative TPR domain protein, component of TonB system [Nitrosopumilales archaeon]
MEEAIKIDPKKTNARFYKGIVLGKMGKHEQALNCFENVCRSNPRNLDAIFHKGIELTELQKHDKAIRIFDDLLRKQKENVNLIYAKARSMAALDEIGLSMELLKKAISKDPKTIRKWAKDEKIFERFHDDEQFRKLVKL